MIIAVIALIVIVSILISVWSHNPKPSQKKNKMDAQDKAQFDKFIAEYIDDVDEDGEPI